MNDFVLKNVRSKFCRTKTCFQLLALAIVALTTFGCQRFDDTYGGTRGTAAGRSVNGLATFRQVVLQLDPDFGPEDIEFDDSDLVSLSDRTSAIDAIVWTPQFHTGIDNKTRGWLDRWLRSGNKTLVYVVADDGSMTDYLTNSIEQVSPQTRFEYRRTLARRSLQRMQPDSVAAASDKWFNINRIDGWIGDSLPTGPWPSNWDDVKPVRAMQTLKQRGNQKSKAKPSVDKAIHWQTLVHVDQDPLVARLASDRWPDSQVIIVGAGSLVTNYAMVKGNGQSIASEIRSSIIRVSQNNVAADDPMDPVKIGFATTVVSEIPVRTRPPQQPVASGMKVLTTWPLSLITIHGLIAGLVACLILLPIFGRARRAPTPDPNRFADHIDAVANLMHKTSGDEFAQNRIERYRRQVQGEERE